MLKLDGCPIAVGVTDYNYCLALILAVSPGPSTPCTKQSWFRSLFLRSLFAVCSDLRYDWMHTEGKPTAKAVPPAKVEMLPHESELASIQLTEDAENRLGIEVAKVSVETHRAPSNVGGEVMLPPGKVIQVTAPVGGN